MGVQARHSDENLHSETILSKITDYDIFRHYCPPFKVVGKKFKSELRKDNSPTASIVKWNNGLLYKDFGRVEHTFNCFGYVMHKLSLDYMEALRVISRDFNLGLDGSDFVSNPATTYSRDTIEEIEEQKPARISIRRREWGLEDKKFWTQFHISGEILVKFGVVPIDYFWINETRFKCHSTSYAFRFSKGYKIYSPYETTHKWYSNIDKTCVQGYPQLPDKSEVLIITSSLKDVMCLVELGYPAIALQSEMQMPSPELIDEMKSRFNIVTVLYDNDYTSEDNPGQTMARKICDEYKLINICIPQMFESKDISDLIRDHGQMDAENIIELNLPYDSSSD